MIIGRNSGDSGELHSVSSQELAVWVGGIDFFTIFRDNGVGVNEGHLIDISGSEFNSVDGVAIEETSSLPHSSDEGRADH